MSHAIYMFNTCHCNRIKCAIHMFCYYKCNARYIILPHNKSIFVMHARTHRALHTESTESQCHWTWIRLTLIVSKELAHEWTFHNTLQSSTTDMSIVTVWYRNCFTQCRSRSRGSNSTATNTLAHYWYACVRASDIAIAKQMSFKLKTYLCSCFHSSSLERHCICIITR